MAILGIALPGPIALIGITVIIAGMALHSCHSAFAKKKQMHAL